MPCINYINMIITDVTYNECVCYWTPNDSDTRLTNYRLLPIFIPLNDESIDLCDGKISHKSLICEIKSIVRKYLNEILDTKIKSYGIRENDIIYTPPYQLNDYEIWIDVVVPVIGDVFEQLKSGVAVVNHKGVRILSSQSHNSGGFAYANINNVCSDDSIFNLSLDSAIVPLITICKLKRKIKVYDETIFDYIL